MKTAFVGAVVIGVMVGGWQGRIAGAVALALFTSADIFLARRQHVNWARRVVKAEGGSAENIVAMENLTKEYYRELDRDLPLQGWKLMIFAYMWQTVLTSIVTLPVALVTGLIRDWAR